SAAPAPASSGPWGNRGSVPQSAPPLPPVDREADALIADLFSRHPEARYRITQTAFVQEHALVQAQNRIQELEWELENAQRQGQAAQSRGGLFGMFGGGQRPAPMPPRPQPMAPPPGYNAMQQGGAQGGGFLRTAAMTAAGVAGGMILGNMLMNAFSGGGAAHAATATGGGFGQEAVPTSASPWSDPGAAAAQQGWGGNDATGGGYQDSGYQDDASAGDAGGYDDGGGYDEEV
ncbi:MAG: DUF2076 domain-containing protein, partial [Acetobacteraceae bacterium]|nr:DUF2076 domain-containing protein [Acetobacteraceae bacterium]